MSLTSALYRLARRSETARVKPRGPGALGKRYVRKAVGRDWRRSGIPRWPFEFPDHRSGTRIITRDRAVMAPLAAATQIFWGGQPNVTYRSEESSGYRRRTGGPRKRASGTPRSTGAGYSVVHIAIDDHSRYAYPEQHTDEKGETCARFLSRARAHFREIGMGAPEAAMTDNAKNYRTSLIFQETLRASGARHILTPPDTPRVNGKPERFIQTMKREWAYADE